MALKLMLVASSSRRGGQGSTVLHLCCCGLVPNHDRATVDSNWFQFSGRGFPKVSSVSLPFHYHLRQEERCLWVSFSQITAFYSLSSLFQ